MLTIVEYNWHVQVHTGEIGIVPAESDQVNNDHLLPTPVTNSPETVQVLTFALPPVRNVTPGSTAATTVRILCRLSVKGFCTYLLTLHLFNNFESHATLSTS